MSIVGIALTEMSEDDYRRAMHDAVAEFSRRKPIDHLARLREPPPLSPR
jgi:hypothetical protein